MKIDTALSLLSSHPSLPAWASAHLLSLCSCFARYVPFCCQDHLDLAGDINVLVESTCSWSVRLPALSPSFPPFSREYHGERLFLHDRKPLRTAEILLPLPSFSLSFIRFSLGSSPVHACAVTECSSRFCSFHFTAADCFTHIDQSKMLSSNALDCLHLPSWPIVALAITTLFQTAQI